VPSKTRKNFELAVHRFRVFVGLEVDAARDQEFISRLGIDPVSYYSSWCSISESTKTISGAIRNFAEHDYSLFREVSWGFYTSSPSDRNNPGTLPYLAYTSHLVSCETLSDELIAKLVENVTPD
jgi:hypothetical protein